MKGRYVASRDEWARLQETLRLIHRVCQVCKRETCGPLGAHHLIGKDLLGDDVIENLALLGGTGTTGCHGLVQELDRRACEDLRSNLTAEQLAYVLEHGGPLTLETYYPERKET